MDKQFEAPKVIKTEVSGKPSKTAYVPLHRVTALQSDITKLEEKVRQLTVAKDIILANCKGYIKQNAELTNQLEAQTKELERVTGLLKDMYKTKWRFVVKGNEDECSIPTPEEDIDSQAEQLWAIYCQEQFNRPVGDKK